MISRDTLIEIATLCGRPVASFSEFDLQLLGLDASDIDPSVLDYFRGNVPQVDISARCFSDRDICRFYPVGHLAEMNSNAIPSCYILHLGFVAFGSDLSGDAFTVDLTDGRVYLVSHEEDWEKLISDCMDRGETERLAVIDNCENVADSIEEFLNILLSQLREIDKNERDFKVAAKIDPSVVNGDGDTFLIVAIKENDVSGFEEILRAGADIEAVSGQNRTVLSEATVYGRIHMLKSLLEQGANPNGPNSHGITPLMMAAKYSQLECAQLLITFGADKSFRDNQGRLAVDHMDKFRDEPKLQILLSLDGS